MSKMFRVRVVDDKTYDDLSANPSHWKEQKVIITGVL